MTTRAVAQFDVTKWEPSEIPSAEGGPKLGRALIAKAFRGELQGTSQTEMLSCQGENGGAGYIAQEVVTGTLAGRTGTFVMQHGGIATSGGQRAFGSIVPGSATGELRGLRGDVQYRHDESGATVTLDYEFEDS
jgi:Protein of unknown function (DUF3224)